MNPDLATHVLDNGCLQAEILPAAGAGLLRLDWLQQGRLTPVFCPIEAKDASPQANAMACYVLLPWSNRIGAGQFEFEGRHITVAPTTPVEPYPIHGHGWLERWTLRLANQEQAELVLQHQASSSDPFAYLAVLRYTLKANCLQVSLSVCNQGPRLPFGLGLHPFLPRSQDVCLQAPATGFWHAGADHLPLDLQPLPPQADFCSSRPLPTGSTINHGFEGWSGLARVTWPKRGLVLDIRSDSTRYVLYTPQQQNFFCFEPVDHPINAHNLPGGAPSHGLTPLEPGQSLVRNYYFSVHAAD